MIEAYVAKIIDARTLVLNKGANDGVEIGMRFAVLNRNGAEIKDPITGDILGSVAVEKTIVKVVDIQDKLSVARTFRQYKGTSFGMLAGLTKEPRLETLQTDETTYKQELSEHESYVKVGDQAVQVLGDEYPSQPD